MRDSKRTGDWGEALAADHLRRKGYEIVARNYRSRFGEIDLIARNAGFIVFVEVKLRASDRFGLPREFVGRKKRERLRATALLWLEAHETGSQPRFDVIEICAPEGQIPKIVHLEDAF